MMLGPFIEQIPKRAECCTLSEEPFRGGDTYYSVLFEGKEGYIRHDYHQKVWDQVKEEATAKGGLCWKGKTPMPEKKDKPQTLKDRLSKAWKIFQTWSEEEDQNHTHHLYFLAMYLRRQRIFTHRKEGKTFDLYEHARSEKMFKIPKIDLTDLQIEAIQKEISEALA